MIISKKKFKEKIAEVLEKEAQKRYIHEKIDRIECECREMVEGAHRHIYEVEKKVEELKQMHGG